MCWDIFIYSNLFPSVFVKLRFLDILLQSKITLSVYSKWQHQFKSLSSPTLFSIYAVLHILFILQTIINFAILILNSSSSSQSIHSKYIDELQIIHKLTNITDEIIHIAENYHQSYTFFINCTDEVRSRPRNRSVLVFFS